MGINKLIEDNKIIFIDKQIPLINTGILFIYATWAPYTYKLNILINSINKKEIKVYVINIDNSDSLYELLRINNLIDNCKIGGWGEIFWFKSKKLIGTMIKDFREEKLTQYNELLS